MDIDAIVKNKIAKVDLTVCPSCKDYTGGLKYEEALKYIQKKYESQKNSKQVKKERK